MNALLGRADYAHVSGEVCPPTHLPQTRSPRAHGTIAPRTPLSHPEWICITQRGTNSSGCACPCPRAHSVCGCSRGRPFPMQVTINGVEDGLTKASNVVGFVPQVRSNALLFCF